MQPSNKQRPVLRWDAVSTTASSGEVTFEQLFLGTQIALGATASFVVKRWMSGASIDQVVRDVEATFHARLSSKAIKQLLEEVEPLFESPEADAERVAAFRDAVAGGALDLRNSPYIERRAGWIRERLAGARTREKAPTRLVGVLTPHGALAQTAALAFRSYARIERDDWPDVFVVVGTSHYYPNTSILTHDVRTRYGVIPTDRELAYELVRTVRPELEKNAPAFLVEHSWQTDLPILQTLGRELDRPVRLVAILTGRTSLEDGERLGAEISHALFERRMRGIFVASGDLSHFGEGYPWTPRWMKGKRTIGSVVDALHAWDARALAGLTSRNIKQYESVVRRSSFCARAQAGALMRFAPSDGSVLGHLSIVNWNPKYDRRNAWSPSDKVFDVASVAFHLSGSSTGARAKGKKICRRVLLHEEPRSKNVLLYHPCDNSMYELPAAAREGILRAFEGTIGSSSPRALRTLVETLAATSLIHEEQPSLGPSALSLKRAEHVIEQARANVVGYAGLRSNRLARAPFLMSSELAAHPRRFLHRTIADRSWKSLADHFDIRFSSGSTGRGRRVISIEEKAVTGARSAGESALGYFLDRMVSLNRPGNLFSGLEIKIAEALGETVLAKKGSRDQVLMLSPGPDPILAAPEIWADIAERVAAHKPVVLEGDSVFVAAFAQYCRTRKISFPSLCRVELGHSYPWRSLRDVIRDAFRVPVLRRYHSGEFGPMALECVHGRMHLLESSALYEIFAHGRPAKRGELGVIVGTTLDSTVRPLVRYVIGDVVRVTGASCNCGKPFRTIDVEGRLRFLFRDGRGRVVTQKKLDDLIGSPRGVGFFQFMVPGRGPIELTIVPDQTGVRVDRGALSDAISEGLGLPVVVTRAKNLPIVEKVVTLARDSEPGPRFVDPLSFLPAKPRHSFPNEGERV